MKAKNITQAVLQQNKGLSTYDIWVVARPGISDIDKIYLNKDEAILIAARLNDSITHVSGIKRLLYQVVSLYDAIEMIKDDVRDSESMRECYNED